MTRLPQSKTTQKGIFFHIYNKRWAVSFTLNHDKVINYFDTIEEAQHFRDEAIQSQYQLGLVRLSHKSGRLRSILCSQGFVVGIWYKERLHGAPVFEIFITDIPIRAQRSIELNGPEDAYVDLCYRYCAKANLTLAHFDVMVTAGAHYMERLGISFSAFSLKFHAQSYRKLLEAQ